MNGVRGNNAQIKLRAIHQVSGIGSRFYIFSCHRKMNHLQRHIAPPHHTYGISRYFTAFCTRYNPSSSFPALLPRRKFLCDNWNRVQQVSPAVPQHREDSNTSTIHWYHRLLFVLHALHGVKIEPQTFDNSIKPLLLPSFCFCAKEV